MRGPEVPLWKRHSAITYRFQQSMPYSQIGKLLNAEKGSIKAIIRRDKERARSLIIEDLQEAVIVQSRARRESVQSLVTLFLKQCVRVFKSIATTHLIELQTTIFINVRSLVK